MTVADATDDSAGVPWATAWARTDPVDLPLPVPGETPDDCPGVDSCEPAVSLSSRMARVEQSVRIMAAGHVHLSNQLGELKAEQGSQRKRLDDTASAIDKLGKDVRENTDLTRDIRDAVITGRTMGRFAKWAAPTLAAAAGAAALAKGWVVDAWHWVQRL